MTIVLLSHGSRHPKAAATVRALCAAVAGRMAMDCREAHLDFNAPDLSTLARNLKAEGREEAAVVPLLFCDAYHRRVDVPQELAAARESSGLRLTLAESLGTDGPLIDVLTRRIDAEAPAGSHVALYSVGSSDEGANEQVQELARALSARSGHSVSSVQATGRHKSSLMELAVMHPSVHVLPLFVAEGLLLDAALELIPKIEQATGARITSSAPLGEALAPVVEQRVAKLHALAAAGEALCGVRP